MTEEQLKVRIEELKRLLQETPDKRAIRRELYEAQERLSILQTKRGVSKPGPKAKRTAIMGAKRGVETGGFYNSAEYERWKAQQIEEDQEGPSKHDIQRATLSVGITKATPRQREMIFLHAQGMGNQEIAKVLGVNRSTVSRTLRRGIKHIKDFADSVELVQQNAVDLTSIIALMPIFNDNERLALRAAENRCEIWEIADLLGRSIDETTVILATAREKLRKD